jgi:hypothetical protein
MNSTIYKKQYAYIKKHFGETHADNANYGWSVTDDCYMTKVYLSPTKPCFIYTIHDNETDQLETFTYAEE